MKRILQKVISLTILLTIVSCVSEEIVPTEELAAPEYTLPKGTPGSADEAIHNIYRKYETFILYDFKESDISKLWTGKWYPSYTPIDTEAGDQALLKIVKVLEEKILSQFDVDFIKHNFPYKVFLVDELSVLGRKAPCISNGYNAIAISGVNAKMETWDDSKWDEVINAVNLEFARFYYPSVKNKLVIFESLRPAKRFRGIEKADPEGVLPKNSYFLYKDGLVKGFKGNTTLTPNADEDFAYFIQFLSSTKGSELKYALDRFEILRERAKDIYNVMLREMNTNLLQAQNNNFPDDTLPLDYFN